MERSLSRVFPLHLNPLVLSSKALHRDVLFSMKKPEKEI